MNIYTEEDLEHFSKFHLIEAYIILQRICLIQDDIIQAQKAATDDVYRQIRKNTHD